MINLLPPEVIDARKYGRKNQKLLKWCMASLMGALGIVLIAAGGYYYITQSEKTAAVKKTDLETRISEEKLDQVQADFKDFSNNLKSVMQILSRQVLFSVLIKQIGGVVPPGVTLNSITLTDKNNALDLTFTTSNESLAPTILVNLQDPKNAIFDKADIINVTCNDVSCSVTVKALLKKDANYLFLNSVSKGTNR